MSDDLIGRGVVEVVGDTSDVTAKIAKVGDDVEKMSRRAQKAGKDASDGIKQIGEGLKQSSDEAGDATKKFEADLKKLISATGGAKRGTTEYLREQAKLKGADSKVLEPLFRQYESVRRGAAAAAAETRKFADSQRFLRGLESQANSIGKTASQLAALKAAQLGVAKEAAPMIAKMREAEQAANKTGGAFAQLSGYVRATVAAFGVREIVRYADSWTELQNRLRLVTSSQADLATATDDVYRIAMTTNQELSSTAEVYQRFAQNADALGISQQKVAEVTETVSKAVAISGASAQAAQAALTQFGQALASGVLRGEEFNSVMEQTPGLAQAIARGMGVAVGELRALAQDGKITADVLIDAISKASDSVDEQFNTRVKTLSQSFTNLQTSVTRYVGELNTSTGLTATFGSAVDLLANNIDTLVAATGTLVGLKLAAWLSTSAVATVGLTGALTAAATAAKVFFASIGPIGWAILAIGTLATAWTLLSDKIKISEDNARALGAVWEVVKDGASAAINAVIDGLEWLGEKTVQVFNYFGMESANAAASIETSFSSAVLAVARSVDEMYAGMLGNLSALGAAFRTIGDNIVSAFTWAFDKVRATFEQLIFDIKDGLNGLGGNFSLTIPTQAASSPAFKSITEEAQKAFNEGAKTLGLYDTLIRKIEDSELRDSVMGWKAAFGETETAAGRTAKAVDDVAKATKGAKKAVDEAAKAAKQFEEDRKRYIQSQYDEVSALSDQSQALEQQIALYGLSEAAKYDLAIADLERQKAALSVIDAEAEEIGIIERKIELLDQMRGSQATLDRLNAEKQAWEQWSRDVEGIFQQVSQSLTDAIFEGGKSGRDLVEDLFKTLTLRVLINPVMGAIQGQITQSLGSALGYSNSAVSGASKSKSAGMPDMDFNQFMGGSIGNNLSSFGSTIGSTMVTEFGAGLTAGAGGALSDAGATALMNIGTEGSKSFAAGSGLGGAGLGSALGYTGAIYSLTQGKYGSAVGTAIGTAILPGVGTAIGGLVGGIADSLFGDEEPKTRHGQWEWADMTGGDWGLKYRDDRQPAGTGDAIVNYARSAVDSANDLLGKLGVNAAIEHFFATTNSSLKGDLNGVASGGSIRSGDSVSTFGLMGLGGDRTKYGYGGWSDADMLPRLQTDIQLSILEAFQTQVDSLPSVLADMIRGVNIRGLDAAGAQALAEQFNAVIQGVDQFRTAVESLPFENLKNLSFDAAANLIQFAGGLDSLNAGLGTYYENFYSEAEQQQKVWADIGKVLDGVGLTVPKTRDSFRALVEVQDLTTEAGQRAYAALLGVSGAFAQVATASEQAAQETARAAQAQAQAQRDILIGNLESAYGAVVSAGQAEITRLQQSFGVTDSALEAYRTKVQALESQFGAMFSSIEGYIKELRGNVEASAMAQYRDARALISTTLVTGQLPDAQRLNDALQVSQRGVTGQVYASRFEQEKAYAILANEMEALKELAMPELDTAKATLAQLEDQYALLRGSKGVAEGSLETLEKQLRAALATEESARSQISLVEQQLDEAKRQYEVLTGIDTSIKDLATAMREFAAAAAAAKTVVVGGGGGGGGGTFTSGWKPDNLPAGASILTAAEKYVLYNPDLAVDQAKSGMSVDQYANYHWNTYGQYEDRDIRYRARGGYTPPGLTWVGEEGPELVNFKQPAMVYTAAQSANLMGGVGGDRETQELLRQVVQRLDRLEAAGRATAVNTSRMDQKLEDAMQGGDAFRTKEVAIA